MTDAEQGLERLSLVLRSLGRVVVAFSGGADSAFLAHEANVVLGTDRVLCATAVSPSLAPEELASCRALSAAWGLAHVELRTAELGDERYRVNDGTRCYWCKSHLMDALAPVALERRATVVLGVNLDDLADHRPGQRAAAERGARFPLVDAGLTKHDVRRLSRARGLETWDKPAAACLASRVPYGTPVSLSTLHSVAAAESALRELGFAQLRVRHYGELARVEVAEQDMARAMELRRQIVAALHGAGYRYVTLDLEALRSGNLNAALDRGATA